MSIGNHLSEIVRQLWASLTGGWYYEPANSIFCNTLHFYIWCTLLILPFLIGIVASNEAIRAGWIFIYILFTFVLFAVLKIIVAYLNKVFDDVEPIITHKTKRMSGKSTNLFRSSLSSFSPRATDSNTIEMIEFITDRGGQAPTVTDNPANSTGSMKRSGTEPGKFQIGATETSSSRRRGPLPKHGSLVSCRDTKLHMRLLASDCGKQASTGVLHLTDSLELLPTSLSSKRNNNNFASHHALQHTISYSRRKYSDPYAGFLSVRCYPTTYRRADKHFIPIRRVHSTGNRMNNVRSLTSSAHHRIDEQWQSFKKDVTACVQDTESDRANIPISVIPKKAVEEIVDNSQEPCCSRSLMTKPNDTKQGTTSKSANETRFVKNTNEISSQDFFVHSKDAKAELAIVGSDLKGEITKFLEELIEKHPETLDAIENVRMNRLGRKPIAENALNESVKLESGEKRQSVDLIVEPSSSTLLSMGDGTHVAYDHEDTSQGAIHSFQDEHGNWWTYAFDDQSSGMAQVLGSSRAISAMFKRRRRNRKVSGSKSMNIHFNSPTSQDDDTDQILSYVSELNGKVHSSYHTLNSTDPTLHKAKKFVSEEAEITPKVKIIDVLSRSGRHLPRQELRLHERKRRQSTSSLECQIDVIADRNASSSSGSLSSTSYDSPISTSSSEGSDDADMSKFIADKPATMFRPTSSGTANIEQSKRHFRHSGELSLTMNKSMRHNRFFSDSVFTSFLDTSSQNPINPSNNASSGGGLTNESGGYVITFTSDPIAALNSKPMVNNSAKNEPIDAQGVNEPKNYDVYERHPHHRRRQSRIRKSREDSIQIDSNVMEHYYKHLRRHHRRNRNNQRRNELSFDPRRSLRALELLQSDNGNLKFVFPSSSADRGVDTSPCNRNLPASDVWKMFNFRSCGQSFNIDTTDWRNISRNSGDSLFSARIANDTVLARNSSAGLLIRRDLRSLSSMRILNDLQSIGMSQSCLRANGATSTTAATSCRTKVNYHYRIKLLPRPFFTGNGFQIKIDRLSLSALFDRNFSSVSAIVDVALSTIIACLAAALGAANVYSGLTLPLFAFVVAGSQFSLLKSVQPDAASPVHGFNWLIAYSRPVYFCLLALLFFTVDWGAELFRGSSSRISSNILLGGFSPSFTQNRTFPTTSTEGFLRFVILYDEGAKPTRDIGWVWSAPWLHLYTHAPFFVSLKTLIATSILFLPIMFTLGFLPQINTMGMHVLEQVDVHVFGATASFSLLSAVFSCGRSISITVALAAVGQFSRHFDMHSGTQNIAFSAFVASTISAAFLTSRWSTNPLVYRMVAGHCRRLFTKIATTMAMRSGRRQRRRRHQNNDKKEYVDRKGRRLSSIASDISARSAGSSTAGSVNGNGNSTTTKPFIKSFCCTAKFTSKANVVEISTAPQPLVKHSQLAGIEPVIGPVSTEPETAVDDHSSDKFDKSADRIPVSLNIHLSNNVELKILNNDVNGAKGRRSSMTSTVSAPDYSNCHTDRSVDGRKRVDINDGNWPKNRPIHSSAVLEPVMERNLDERRNEVATELSMQHRSKSAERLHNNGMTPSPTSNKRNLWRRSSSSTASHKKTADSSPTHCQKADKWPPPKADEKLPERIRLCVVNRLYYDIFYVAINTLLMFSLHSTSLFTSAQPYFEMAITTLCAVVSVMNHYLYPHLRKHTPWKLLARPVLRAHEFGQHEAVGEARLTVFEKLHTWLLVLEKTLLYPLLVASLLTTEAWRMPFGEITLTALCGFRIARSAFSQPQLVYAPLIVTCALQFVGVIGKSQLLTSKLFVLYALTAIWPKLEECALKLNFIFVYIAPWQISWGSAFHAFAQPFSVPHTGVMCAQAALSSLISAPLNPFLGSSFFLMSYVRPLKFWEKDYNTKRIDHSNLRLISQLDRGPMIDDSNLNAVFYEHLTHSLQKWLAGDLMLGRWATAVQQGDYFILASLYINCLVHIIEVGNGFVTFQVRGLEFRGTYCHQREVEAISEDLVDGGDCCCCTVGKMSGLLSFNNAWSLRWLAWEVVSAKYIIDGYSITDNSAVNLLQVHELRRLLVTLYVKCIIYYALTAAHLDEWLTNETVLKAVEPMLHNPRFIETDPIFSHFTDEDYDFTVSGIPKACFVDLYGGWIKYCWSKRCESAREIDLNLVNCFTFALSILGRRALSTASFNRHVGSAESFLFGLHALLKGDMRITSLVDEWVFTDPEILTAVISPAVRMSLKLHQDHFLTMDEFEDAESLYDRICDHQSRVFISHEHDPAWRAAIIDNTPSLLALRHIFDDGQGDYKIIMLNRMALNMRVIKLNRECVRAFWSGQQQELIFLRNRNPERGSIQNARQVLRNMINSSADQPIGYPIYVSPLVTSFVEMHPQVGEQIFGAQSPTFCGVWRGLRHTFGRLRRYIGASSTSSNWCQSTCCADGDPPPPQPAKPPIQNESAMQPAIFTSSSSRSAQQPAGGRETSRTSGHQPLVVGPAVSPAGSTPAPYRKHTGYQSGGSTDSQNQVTGANRCPSPSSASPSISAAAPDYS